MDSGVPKGYGKSPANQPSRIAQTGIAVTAGWPADESREAAVRGVGFGWSSWPSRWNTSTCRMEMPCQAARSARPAAGVGAFLAFRRRPPPGIRLPKPRSAASAFRVQAPLARQLRGGRRDGKAWSSVHPAPCREGIGAIGPRSWRRRRHQRKPGIAMCYLVWLHY